MLLRVAMLWSRAGRVNRGVDHSADFEICFVIGKELLPMFKTLEVVRSTDHQAMSTRSVNHLTLNSLSVRPRMS